MKVLTVYHKLLIYFINRKNKILKDLTGFDYVTSEDLKELISWPKEDVKKFLSNMHELTDIGNCPWCAVYLQQPRCPDCGYGKRNGWCEKSLPRSRYLKILIYIRTAKIIGKDEGIHNIPSVVKLIKETVAMYRILPYII